MPDRSAKMCITCFPGPEYSFYVPQCAQGADVLAQRLSELPGFDHEAFSAAMCSTDNAFFPLLAPGCQSSPRPSRLYRPSPDERMRCPTNLSFPGGI